MPVLLTLTAATTALAGCAEDEPAASPTTFVSLSMSSGPTTAPTITPTATPTPTIIGNGVTQLAPADVLVRAKRATENVPSVRMRGRVHEQGQLVSVDLRVQKNKATGWVSLDGQRLDIRLIGSTFYFKPDDAFLKEQAGADAVESLSGRWLKTKPGNKDVAEFVSWTSMATIMAEFPDAGEAIYARKGTPTKIHGLPAIPIVDGTGGKLFVATEGDPYLLRIELGKGKDYIDFLEHGKPVSVERPPSRLVIDVDKVS